MVMEVAGLGPISSAGQAEPKSRNFFMAQAMANAMASTSGVDGDGGVPVFVVGLITRANTKHTLKMLFSRSSTHPPAAPPSQRDRCAQCDRVTCVAAGCVAYMVYGIQMKPYLVRNLRS
eukprot:m.136026 g.136026  ORF g.136026 m.136026 type:complete len:119 (+) comp29829_c0_seq13:149-505(+)